MDFLHSLSKDELIELLVKTGTEFPTEVLEILSEEQLYDLKTKATEIIERRVTAAMTEGIKSMIESLLTEEDGYDLDIVKITNHRVKFTYLNYYGSFRKVTLKLRKGNFLEGTIVCKDSECVIYGKDTVTGRTWGDYYSDFADKISENFIPIFREIERYWSLR